MMGRKQQRQPHLFYTGFCLDDRIGADNTYRQIRDTIDLSFVRPAVAHLYGDVGNPSIDPIVVLKLMLIAFLENLPSERELMRRLPERLDWLWFCDYDLDSDLPNHSVPSKARRRWGLELFELFFGRILTQCIGAGLVDGQTIHLDASLIAGDVSPDSLEPSFAVLARQKFEQLEANCDVPIDDPPAPSAKIKATTKLSATDPDARCRTKGSQRVIGYQEHRVVDDAYGIITASDTTDASADEGTTLEAMVDQHEANTDTKATTVVADKAYGSASNYKYLQDRGQRPCIPHVVEGGQKDKFAHGQFVYDAAEDCYVCPAGQRMHRARSDPDRNRIHYRLPKGTCDACPLRASCTDAKHGRTVHRNMDQDAVDWADGCLSKGHRRRLMSRRKSCIEGSFGDAATHHGFKRARWRRRWRVKLQNLMIATIQNLRKLLKYGRRTPRTASVAAPGGVLPAYPAESASTWLDTVRRCLWGLL